MKICEFTHYELHAQEDAALKRAGKNNLIVMPSPTERAMQLLLLALKTVNQAGLDGKELSDLTIVYGCDMAKHPDDQKIEIHAKVKHRFAARAGGGK
jgi:hypothetical protein